MSDIRAYPSITPRRVSSDTGSPSGVHSTRDSALIAADWWMARAIEGRMFGVDTATGTTPDTFNATYAAAEPDLYIYVPANTAIMPVYISVGFEDTGTAQVLDVFAIATSTGDSAVTGTTETINSLHMGAPLSSGCTATSVVTSNGTAPESGNYFEFWRPYMGFGEDAFNGSTGFVNEKIHGVSWSAKETGVYPIIPGGGALAIYASGQAATGFITCVFVELPETMVL
ncbi:MAG: hypothetical protein IPL72_17280 [Sulfuritalea sp.]|nr:hypothetical protein [Sulfuritalea sp.]